MVHHEPGYQPFWVEVPASTNANRELVVLVDNRFNATTAPTHTVQKRQRQRQRERESACVCVCENLKHSCTDSETQTHR